MSYHNLSCHDKLSCDVVSCLLPGVCLSVDKSGTEEEVQIAGERGEGDSLSWEPKQTTVILPS